MKKPTKSDILSLSPAALILFILCGLGLFSLHGSLYGLYQIQHAKSWPSVMGKMTEARISQHRTPKGPHVGSKELKYEYEIHNILYSGDREYFGFTIATNNERLGAYRKNHAVKIYYNPQNPAQSVLNPAKYRGIWLPLCASFAFLLFSVIGFYMILIRLGLRTLPYKILRLGAKVSNWNKKMGRKYNVR